MENEPVERSLLRCIHFKMRLKWLRQNDEHIHDIFEQQAHMPRFADLHNALTEVTNIRTRKKSTSKLL